MSMIFPIHECEEKLGYSFSDKALLRTCFTHNSYANEHGVESNEKLEFLGDSVLSFTVAEHLYKTCSGDEGDLTKLRAGLVSTLPLSRAACDCGLDKFMLLGEGEKKNGVRDTMCENLFEAIVGGIYLDGGVEKAKKFIYDKLINASAGGTLGKSPLNIDYKSRLQEMVQAGRKKGRIEYVVLGKNGPDHAPTFTCGVNIDGALIASGDGSSKKNAEQKAAEKAINKLKKASKVKG